MAQVDGGYVNYPGSVLLHLADGTVQQFKYGDYVDANDLADYQKETLHRFVDGQPRKPEHELATTVDAAREQVAQSGQDFSAVPADYDSLDEAEAMGVVRSYNRSAARQGQVLAYEALNQNRTAVLDSATESGREKQAAILAQVKGPSGVAPQTEAPPPAVQQPVEPPAPEPVVEPEPETPATSDVPPPAEGDVPPPAADDGESGEAKGDGDNKDE